MCGLRTRPRTDVDPPRVELPSVGRAYRLAAPGAIACKTEHCCLAVVSERCVYGDYKGLLYVAGRHAGRHLSCKQISVEAPHKCYESEFETDCCDTCPRIRRTDIPGNSSIPLHRPGPGLRQSPRTSSGRVRSMSVSVWSLR